MLLAVRPMAHPRPATFELFGRTSAPTQCSKRDVTFSNEAPLPNANLSDGGGFGTCGTEFCR